MRDREGIKGKGKKARDFASGVSSLPEKRQVVAVLTSDWHLSANVPLCRAENETAWFYAQARYMQQVLKVAKDHNAPIFIAGDVFDKWNVSPSIINLAIATLSGKGINIYAIPGQHDIPYHTFTELNRSAYWTLVESNTIKHITPTFDMSLGIETFQVGSFPWGFDVKPPPKDAHSLCLNLAIVHDYIWTAKTGHAKASPKKRFSKWLNRLAGYNIAHFGDNHAYFCIQKPGRCGVVNTGTLIRRKTNEIEYKPSVALIKSDGGIERHSLDTSEDKFKENLKAISALEKGFGTGLDGFVSEMIELRDMGINWKDTVKRAIELKGLEPSVVREVMRAVEDE